MEWDKVYYKYTFSNSNLISFFFFFMSFRKFLISTLKLSLIYLMININLFIQMLKMNLISLIFTEMYKEQLSGNDTTII